MSPSTMALHGRRGPLSTRDGIGIVVGTVVGASIFTTPALVAASAGSEAAVLALWLAGGLVSLVGALCYAELAAAFPDAGGEYHFLKRAFGPAPAFLFAWSRFTVVQTGSVAMMAFVLADHARALLGIAPWSAVAAAVGAILALTAVNAAGVRRGRSAQNLLSGALVAGLAAVVVLGLGLPAAGPPAAAPAPVVARPGAAMIFVLLSYGGWSEAAYLSRELGGRSRAVVRVLVGGVIAVAALYVALNLALVRALGLPAMAASPAVLAELMRAAVGEGAALVLALLAVVAALATMNAGLITGARSTWAMARDHPALAALGRWDHAAGPRRAVAVQGLFAAGLVSAGAAVRGGFATMVEYTAPVYWLFLLLVGVALFVLRRREPGRARPFRVPLYPLTPLAFCAASAYMLWASVRYTGPGALAGVAVLLAGVPVLWLRDGRSRILRRLAAALAVLVLAAMPAGAMPPTPTPLAEDGDSLDVVFVPTPPAVVDEMLRLAEVGRDDVLYDLGCGDGRIVIAAARARGARAVGIDADPARIAESRANALRAGVAGRVRFVQQDFFETDLRPATVLSLYLLGSLNERLRPRILAQLRPGSRVVSHAFGMGEWEPDAQRVVSVEGIERHVYLWIVPAQVDGVWRSAADATPATRLTLDQRFQKLRGTVELGGRALGVRVGHVEGERVALTAASADGGDPVALRGRLNGTGLELETEDGKSRWALTRESPASPTIERTGAP